MNKKKKLIIEIVIFVILLLCITLCYNFLINGKTAKGAKNMEIKEIENSKQFEEEVLNESETVFVDFYATWCMPCKTMSSIIDEIANEHTEVKFVKVDVDKNEELAIKYNVMSIPTMLVIKNGEVTKTFIGITDKENIIKEF